MDNLDLSSKFDEEFPIGPIPKDLFIDPRVLVRLINNTEAELQKLLDAIKNAPATSCIGRYNLAVQNEMINGVPVNGDKPGHKPAGMPDRPLPDPPKLPDGVKPEDYDTTVPTGKVPDIGTPPSTPKTPSSEPTKFPKK